MSYRATMISVSMLLLILAGVMLSPWVLPQAFADRLLSAEGVFLGVAGLVAFGMSVMMPSEIPCAHCGQQNGIHIDMLTGKPSLRRGATPSAPPYGHRPSA